jgi:formate hydrogenlyase subunit 6/NADH:ubiquinone oxidoreductase subunit I
MLRSKLKEAVICFKNLRVTLPYPAQPAPAPEGFRGRLEIDIDKCIGCGACAIACPPRLINIVDLDSKRTFEFVLGKCTYCARCAEVCPEQAIAMSREFELATENKGDLNITMELTMAKCQDCGTAFTTQRVIDKLAAVLPEKIEIEPAALDWLNLCPDCRKLREVHKLTEAGR